MKQEYLDDYIQLWNTVEINPKDKKILDSQVNKIIGNKNRYLKAGIKANVPWYIIACIHSLEASLNFSKHLHNGDPLSARTVRVPAGRPEVGNPPFSWEESAADAMSMKVKSGWSSGDLNKAREGDPYHTLYLLERYNGLGYRKYHPEVKTPYLWSKTNKYTKGKYTADGKFDPEAGSNQIGAAALLKVLEELGEVTFSEFKNESKPIIYQGSSRGEIKDLQCYMNQVVGKIDKSSGIGFGSESLIAEDGLIGPKTLARFKKVFGFDMIS